MAAKPDDLTKLIERSVDEFKLGLVSLVSSFLATSTASEPSPAVKPLSATSAAEAAVDAVPGAGWPRGALGAWCEDGGVDTVQVDAAALQPDDAFSGLLPGQPASAAPARIRPRLVVKDGSFAPKPSASLASSAASFAPGPARQPTLSTGRRARLDDDAGGTDPERFLEVVKVPTFVTYEDIASAALNVCGDGASRVTRPLAYQSPSSCVVQCSTRAQAHLLRAFLDGLRTDDNTRRIMWVQPLSSAEARCRGFSKDAASLEKDKHLRNLCIPYVLSAVLGGITALCIVGRRDTFKRAMVRVWSALSWSVQLFAVLFWCRAAVLAHGAGGPSSSASVDALIACKLALLCLLGLMTSMSEGHWLALPFGVNSLTIAAKDGCDSGKGALFLRRTIKISIVVPLGYGVLLSLMLGTAWSGLGQEVAGRAGIASHRLLLSAGAFMSCAAMASLQIRWQMMCSCARCCLADIMHRMLNQQVDFKTIRFDFYRIWGVTARAAIDDRLGTSVAGSAGICFVVLLVGDVLVLIDILNSELSMPKIAKMTVVISLSAVPVYGVSYAMWCFATVADAFAECLFLMMRRHVTVKWTGEDDIDVGVFISYCTSAATLDRHPMCYTVLGLPITKTLLSRVLYAAASVVTTVVGRYAFTSQ